MSKIQKYSEVFKALGHPVRLKIAAGLLKNECNVGGMVSKLGLPQSTVSQHLAVLKHAGVILPRKDGVKTCYKVVDKNIIHILKEIGK